MIPLPWATVPYLVLVSVKNVFAFINPDSPFEKAISCGLTISLSAILVGMLCLWRDRTEKWIVFLVVACAIAELVVSALTLADVVPVNVRRACNLSFIGFDVLLLATSSLYWLIGRQVRSYNQAKYE